MGSSHRSLSASGCGKILNVWEGLPWLTTTKVAAAARGDEVTVARRRKEVRRP